MSWKIQINNVCGQLMDEMSNSKNSLKGKMLWSLHGHQYAVNLDKFYHISIPLRFNESQANHFGAPLAKSEPLRGEGFIGDTRQGGSCNVDYLKMIPHCNGTHTECLGHIVDPSYDVHSSLVDAWIPTVLLSVRPRLAADTIESYMPQKDLEDRLICREDLERALKIVDRKDWPGLLVRTLPNDEKKKNCIYGTQEQASFFSLEAMEFIEQMKVQHLLVDAPSIDRMYDDGLLNNHHFFWHIDPKDKGKIEPWQWQKTITEMVYVENQIEDGLYCLNLQIAPFSNSDASPSRPILFPMEMQ